MLSHEEMIGLQAEQHYLIKPEEFKTKEEFVLHLIHSFAYESVSSLSVGKKVLDFGCNTGYGTNIVNVSCEYICGVDVSAEAIDEAKNKYKKKNIDFKVIDGKSLPFADKYFELIVSFQVLEHIVDHKAYIAEIRRTLVEDDGVVVFTTPNKDMRLDEGMKPWNEFHVREYTHHELQELLSTFFPFVKVLGLFAKDELYKIEHDRLTKAKLDAKNSNEKNLDTSLSIRDLVKKIIPNSFLKLLRKQLDRLLLEKNQSKIKSLDSDFIKSHSTSDLYYSDTNIFKSLDLIAICADNQSSLDDSINLLLKK